MRARSSSVPAQGPLADPWGKAALFQPSPPLYMFSIIFPLPSNTPRPPTPSVPALLSPPWFIRPLVALAGLPASNSCPPHTAPTPAAAPHLPPAPPWRGPRGGCREVRSTASVPVCSEGAWNPSSYARLLSLKERNQPLQWQTLTADILSGTPPAAA